MKTFEIFEIEDSLEIDFLNTTKPILKFGFIFQAVIYILFSIGSVFVILHTMFEIANLTALFFLIPLTFGILMFLAGRKYFNQSFYHQEILIKNGSLHIFETTLFSQNKKSYPLNEISYLTFSGQQKLTDHIMTHNSFDAFGFGTQEKEIQNIIADGTISFFYQGTTIRFGKNIPSWDAEEILEKINTFTENKITKTII